MSNEFNEYVEPVVEEPVAFTGFMQIENTEDEESLIEPITVSNEEVDVEAEVEPVEELFGVVGMVVDCKLLAVRSKPNKKSESVAIIPIGSEVKIDMDSSTLGWYAVITEYGDVGYCMKEFIAVI